MEHRQLHRATVLVFSAVLAASTPALAHAQRHDWMFGPFEKPREVNPVITPSPASTFF